MTRDDLVSALVASGWPRRRARRLAREMIGPAARARLAAIDALTPAEVQALTLAEIKAWADADANADHGGDS